MPAFLVKKKRARAKRRKSKRNSSLLYFFFTSLKARSINSSRAIKREARLKRKPKKTSEPAARSISPTYFILENFLRPFSKIKAPKERRRIRKVISLKIRRMGKIFIAVD
jgi:hypothetical protein